MSENAATLERPSQTDVPSPDIRDIHCFTGEKVRVPDGLGVFVVARGVPVETGREQPAMFSILTPKDGDKRVVWDKRSMAEINAARQLFNDLLKQGMVAFKVDNAGKPTSQRMDKFDPGAQEVVFYPVRAVAGG